jgi:protein-disulfide isomerase
LYSGIKRRMNMLAGRFFLIAGLCLALIFSTGCTDNTKLNEVEKRQKDILAKLSVIEENQEKILKFFQPKKPIDVDRVQDIPIGSSPVKGNRKALVTIVEFSDFQCPYCSRLQPTLREVLKAYPKEVKLVFKDFPLSFHKQAKNAAKAARAAGEQGKYWEMHDLIFENYNKLTEEMFSDFAVQLGLDMKTFTADYTGTKYDSLIQDDMALGQKVGVRGTPTLFLNGKRMASRSFNDFKGEIDNVLKK